MPVVRWVSFLLSAECVFALWLTPRGPGTLVLAILLAIFFTIFCATLGAFAPTTDSEITNE